MLINDETFPICPIIITYWKEYIVITYHSLIVLRIKAFIKVFDTFYAATTFLLKILKFHIIKLDENENKKEKKKKED